MATHNSLDTVLRQLEALHRTHAGIQSFCPFPDDVQLQHIAPFHMPASDLLQSEGDLKAKELAVLRDALIGLSPEMMWRETYKDTDIGADFMNRFGCYEVIGRDGPFASKKMRGFMVYQPPHLHYPWHHHPADELYLVIAGEAEFHLQGHPPRTLTSGQTAFHPSGMPHALTSHNSPVMAYVVWRDNFDVGPVWSDV